jgi:hypothetical protein
MIVNPRARGKISRRKVRGFLRGLRGLAGLPAGAIATYAANAGFSGADLDTAVAIALAESSGNPSSVGDRLIGGSVGLWQIYLPMHPEFAGWDLTDPQTNANAAYSVYRAAGNSFTPWTTFKTGAYRAYLSSQPSAVSSQPLTIDAATGQVIDDSTPTPGDASSPAGVPANLLWLGGAAVAAYWLFFGD